MSIWDALEKATYTGLGLAALTKEKLEEAVETLKKERGLTEEEGRKLSEELKGHAESLRVNLDERIETVLSRTLDRLNIPTKDDLKNLETRLESLEKKLEDRIGE